MFFWKIKFKKKSFNDNKEIKEGKKFKDGKKNKEIKTSIPKEIEKHEINEKKGKKKEQKKK